MSHVTNEIKHIQVARSLRSTSTRPMSKSHVTHLNESYDPPHEYGHATHDIT